jgi:hypothetical protein
MPALRYVKNDAEGSELLILRGATGVLAKYRPLVAFEHNGLGNDQFAFSAADLAHFWSDRDYILYDIHGRRLTEGAFIASAQQRTPWDYVAVPAEAHNLERTVRETLQQARVNWQAVWAHLRQAALHAEVGAQVPPLRRFRGPWHALARLAARVVLYLGEIVTGPQREHNRLMMRCLGYLADGLERAEQERAHYEARLRRLEAMLEVTNDPWPPAAGQRFGCTTGVSSALPHSAQLR